MCAVDWPFTNRAFPAITAATASSGVDGASFEGVSLGAKARVSVTIAMSMNGIEDEAVWAKEVKELALRLFTMKRLQESARVQTMLAGREAVEGSEGDKRFEVLLMTIAI